MKIIILLFLLSIFNIPAPDPECISDWYLLREVPSCSYCKEQDPYGDYSLYVCTIKKSSPAYGEYFTVKFKSICQYEEREPIPAQDVQFTFLPIVVIERTTIGEPIRVP